MWDRRINSSLLRRLLLDDAGQDLIEYALLAALVGAVSVLAWQAIAASIGAGYTGWDGQIQGLSTTTPDPGAAGS